MYRNLLTKLQWLEAETNITTTPDTWLDDCVHTFDGYCQRLYGSIVADGIEKLYLARGHANIALVDLLYHTGYSTLQYPIQHLVIATGKGLIPIPSPFGSQLLKRLPEWRDVKPVIPI